MSESIFLNTTYPAETTSNTITSWALPASFVSTTISKPTSIVAVAFHGTNIGVVEPTTSLPLSSPASSVGVMPAATTSSPSSSTTASHRLSQNSLVGITIGGAFGLFFLFSLVGLLIIRRQRAVLAKKAEKQPRKRCGRWKQEVSGADGKFEMDGNGKRFELVSERHLAHEMAVQERPGELAG